MPLQAAMPHNRLDPAARAVLAAHLRRLSATLVPGIAEGKLHLGIPLAPDVPPERRDAALGVLKA